MTRTKALGSVGPTAHNISLAADHPHNRLFLLSLLDTLPCILSGDLLFVHVGPAFGDDLASTYVQYCFPAVGANCQLLVGGCGLPLLLQLKTPFMEHAGWIGNHWKKPELAITTLWFVDFRDNGMGVLVVFRDNGV